MTESDEPVRVAVGVVRRDDTILLCQRGINHRYGLKWEFPGGKLYPDETTAECLARELSEELGIEPVRPKELKTLRIDYPDGGKFLLTFFLVTAWSGEMENRVFEQIVWVPVDEVHEYDLLQGSRPILRYLESPAVHNSSPGA